MAVATDVRIVGDQQMTPEQLEGLRLAVKVIFAGAGGTFSLEDHVKLRRASGLERHVHECAEAVIVDEIARRGFFAPTIRASR